MNSYSALTLYPVSYGKWLWKFIYKIIFYNAMSWLDFFFVMNNAMASGSHGQRVFLPRSVLINYIFESVLKIGTKDKWEK